MKINRHCRHKNPSNYNSIENKEQIIIYYNKCISNSHASELPEYYAIKKKIHKHSTCIILHQFTIFFNKKFRNCCCWRNLAKNEVTAQE